MVEKYLDKHVARDKGQIPREPASLSAAHIHTAGKGSTCLLTPEYSLNVIQVFLGHLAGLLADKFALLYSFSSRTVC